MGALQIGALAAIHVLDLTDHIAGHFCSRMLADYGAEVLLIEPPAGCALRTAAPLDVDGTSFLFRHLNTGKSSACTLTPALAGAADIILIDATADQAALAAMAPDAIIATISAFGTDGPWRDWQGCEMIYQALAGLMHASGEAGRAPLYGCGDRASFGAGVAACITVLAALYARSRLGVVQPVAVDIAETAACMANPFVTQFLYNGIVDKRMARRTPIGWVQCPDGWVGYYLHVHLYAPMCLALGLPDLATDPRFAPPKARLDNWQALTAEIQAHCGGWPADVLVAKLQSARVVTSRAFGLAELRGENLHLDTRDFWETLPGGNTILGPQFRFSATPRGPATVPPSVGNATGFTTQRRAWPAPKANSSAGPLAGLRVVEFTTAWAGPMAGRILAWLGAEVVHVESAGRLDSWRQHGQVFSPGRYPKDGAGARPWNRCALFNSQNANKLSLSLDAKDPGAKAALDRLLAKTDVVLCNFTAGTLARMGFGYDRLRTLKPDIIVAEMPPFGSTGPLRAATAIGPSMEMAAGMASMIGYEGGPPAITGPTYPDPVGALNAAAAVLIALMHRQSTGAGQHVEIPQVEAGMHFIGEHILTALASGQSPRPRGNRVDWAAPHDAFPAAGEDEWIAIAATSDAAWSALSALIGLPPDPRFATLAGRKAHEDDIAAAIAVWTASQDKHAAAARLQAAGIAAAPVQNGRDGANSRYLHAKGYFTNLVHPEIGPVVQEGLPFHLAATPGRDRFAAPCLGAHTTHILADIAGLTPAEIASLDTSGATSATPL